MNLVTKVMSVIERVLGPRSSPSPGDSQHISTQDRPESLRSHGAHALNDAQLDALILKYRRSPSDFKNAHRISSSGRLELNTDAALISREDAERSAAWLRKHPLKPR